MNHSSADAVHRRRANARGAAYDGLLYFRLTQLGAYCLGLTDKYVPTQVTVRATISVLPSLRINVIGILLCSNT